MSALEDDIDALGRGLTAFVETLRNEAEALRGPDAEALADAVARKTALAAEVGAAWERFAAHASTPPLSIDRIQQALDRFPALQKRWRAVRQLAEEAARLNQANGQQIELQLQRTHRALDVLQTAANPARVYGEQGQILNLIQPQRTLDKA